MSARTAHLTIAFICSIVLPTHLSSAKDLETVRFDAPAIVVAELVNPDVVTEPTTGGKLVRLRIAVSTRVDAHFAGQVSEFTVEFLSPTHTMRMLDYWPKHEVYSDVEGNISIERSLENGQAAGVNLSASYEPWVRGGAKLDSQVKTNLHQRFAQKPQLQLLASSGTMQRGYGVFFKFRPGPVATLDGTREVAFLAEVPTSWRADMLQVIMRASGSPHRSSQHNSNQSSALGSCRLWTIVHLEGDAVAAAQAQRLVIREQNLRAMAASSQSQVTKSALPSVWHKIGAAFDVVEPRIPADYLNDILFASRNIFRDHPVTNHLPVNLRVAVLDYWEDREQLMQLASSQRIVARPTFPSTLTQAQHN